MAPSLPASNIKPSTLEARRYILPNGEPCWNPDWNPADETVFEFADRMRVEKGWLHGTYLLPHPRDGAYPLLRVDEDSILWTAEVRIHMHIHGCMCDPKEPAVVLIYVSTAANHELLMERLKADGLLAGTGYERAQKILSEKRVDRK